MGTSETDPLAVAMPRETHSDQFKRLYDEHRERVVYFFLRKGFSKEDARDLTQDTFIRVYNGLKGYREDASESTWIFRIARNVYLNHRRYRNAHRRAGTDVSLDEMQDGPAGTPLEDTEAQSPWHTAHRHQRAERLQQAMEELPPQMRRVVRLRAQDFKYREIADIMGLSIDTIKSQLHQAKQKLRQTLDDLKGDLGL